MALLAAVPLSAATLDVQVTNPAGAAVREALVYAIPPSVVPIERTVVQMDQVDRQFVPHVLPIQTGTWVEFPNSDNIRHQVYSVSPVRRFQLPLYAGKPAYPIQFPKSGVVPIGCNIHEQMNAYIVVVDTPYFALVNEGRASLRGLKAGQYTVRVWYPQMSQEPPSQSVILGADGQQSVSFVVGK